ncbi:MAG: hypothetical protein ACR2MN_18425 [Acidimicrobiales bacterium]
MGEEHIASVIAATKRGVAEGAVPTFCDRESLFRHVGARPVGGATTFAGTPLQAFIDHGEGQRRAPWFETGS